MTGAGGVKPWASFAPPGEPGALSPRAPRAQTDRRPRTRTAGTGAKHGDEARNRAPGTAAPRTAEASPAEPSPAEHSPVAPGTPHPANQDQACRSRRHGGPEHRITAVHRDLLGRWNTGTPLTALLALGGAGQGDAAHRRRWRETYGRG